jgi:hypothetical protein
MRRPKIAFQTTRAGTFWTRATVASEHSVALIVRQIPLVTDVGVITAREFHNRQHCDGLALALIAFCELYWSRRAFSTFLAYTLPRAVM